MKKFIIIFFLLISIFAFINKDTIYYSYEKISNYTSNKWYIKIPKLNLFKEIKDNDDVDHNVIILDPIQYPNKDKSTMILAAHSGSSIYSYFNNLYKLEINDLAYIYNKNIKYNYKLVNIYIEKKTGKIKIYKDDNKCNLVLITCTNNDKNTQTIYVFEKI